MIIHARCGPAALPAHLQVCPGISRSRRQEHVPGKDLLRSSDEGRDELCHCSDNYCQLSHFRFEVLDRFCVGC